MRPIEGSRRWISELKARYSLALCSDVRLARSCARFFGVENDGRPWLLPPPFGFPHLISATAPLGAPSAPRPRSDSTRLHSPGQRVRQGSRGPVRSCRRFAPHSWTNNRHGRSQSRRNPNRWPPPFPAHRNQHWLRFAGIPNRYWLRFAKYALRHNRLGFLDLELAPPGSSPNSTRLRRPQPAPRRGEGNRRFRAHTTAGSLGPLHLAPRGEVGRRPGEGAPPVTAHQNNVLRREVRRCRAELAARSRHGRMCRLRSFCAS